jgi:hypothetical protein
MPPDESPVARPAEIAVLFAAALVLRCINLDSGLWVDEIYSLASSFRPPLVQIITVFPRDNHHPF